MKYKITLEAELESEFYSSLIPSKIVESILRDMELGYVGFNDLKILASTAEEIKT